jgi:hypothetical protein
LQVGGFKAGVGLLFNLDDPQEKSQPVCGNCIRLEDSGALTIKASSCSSSPKARRRMWTAVTGEEFLMVDGWSHGLCVTRCVARHIRSKWPNMSARCWRAEGRFIEWVLGLPRVESLRLVAGQPPAL